MSDKRKSNGGARTRNYATVVYPESAPENWLDILRDMKFNALVSPLHDSDVNPDGEVKKAHYHVMFMFDSVKSRDQAEQVASAIGGVGLETVNAVRGYARYLCHLDNPEKHQYSPEDVLSIGSEDYYALISLPSDKYGHIKEMIAWCEENQNYYYSDLLRYAMSEREDWFRTLCDNGTYVMKEFLKAENFKRKKQCEDSENGY